LTDKDDFGDVPETYQEAIALGYKPLREEMPLAGVDAIKTWNAGPDTACMVYACVNHRQTILYRDADGNCTRPVYRDC
jgi:hypothetical protein